MKKLNKLQINSEKIMKNEELIALRGGYDPLCCTCIDKDTHEPVGYMVADNAFYCSYLCGWVNSQWIGSYSC